jgi:hypothetical protein
MKVRGQGGGTAATGIRGSSAAAGQQRSRQKVEDDWTDLQISEILGTYP